MKLWQRLNTEKMSPEDHPSEKPEGMGLLYGRGGGGRTGHRTPGTDEARKGASEAEGSGSGAMGTAEEAHT